MKEIPSTPVANQSLNVACTVIHHCNVNVLKGTLDSLISDGLEPHNVLVVDNSGKAVSEQELLKVLVDGMVLHRVNNDGYGSAANHGIRHFLERLDPPEFILIATHEVRPLAGAVRQLKQAMEMCPSRMAVGPALVSATPAGKLRVSAGGERSRILGIPRHVEVKGSSWLSSEEIYDRLWLDGAFVLYRSSALVTEKFREEFFLYYEETELHYRLIDIWGERAVACVTGAVVEETSRGVPSELKGRNQQWLLDLHGNWWQRQFTVPYIIARDCFKVAVGRGSTTELLAVVRSWRSARRNPLFMSS